MNEPLYNPHPQLQKRTISLNQLPARNLLIKPILPTITETLTPREETTPMPPPSLEESDPKLSILEMMHRRKGKGQFTPSNPKVSEKEEPPIKRIHEVPAELLPILYEMEESDDKSP